MSHGLPIAAALLVLGACAVQPPPGGRTNPLLTDWQTPFGAPPFDAIQAGHFEPAFEAAIERHLEEVRAIVADPSPPTFANTVEALERSGETLARVRAVFTNLNQADTDEQLQDIARRVNPALAAHQDDILLDAGLFARIEAVHHSVAADELTPEQWQLLEKTYRRFLRGGAGLGPEAAARLRELNSELSSLTTRFGDNLLAGMNAVALLVEDESELAGLPDEVRGAAAALASANGHEGAWAFNLQRSSWTPVLQSATNRELRRRLYESYLGLGGAEGLELAARIAALRAERALVLGYPTHAHYQLEETMAGTPEGVRRLLDQLWSPALARAAAERDDLEGLARVAGDDLELAGWDWSFYADQLRAERFDFDEGALKPYLELESVRRAAFEVAGRLFGITFSERSDVPVYHPDVRVWEVTDADGSHVGLFYTDYLARKSKRGGAWMDSYREQWRRADGTEVRPIVVNVCNFAPPGEGQPVLLSLDEAATLFHELGHALHGLLSSGSYVSLSGTNVPRDFVELPSQMMENWAFAPEVLPSYARHVETGEPIPAELVAKLQRARRFNQGFATTEYLAASLLDLAWHTLPEPRVVDAAAFEAEVLGGIGLLPEIAPRYRTSYFGHIFSGDYSAGYYSYVWAEVLDADGFEAFRSSGLFDPVTARAFREHILEAGASEPPMELYRRFRGAEPSIGPLLARRGLDAPAAGG